MQGCFVASASSMQLETLTSLSRCAAANFKLQHCKRLATTPWAREFAQFAHSRRVQAKTRDGQRCSPCRGTSLGGELRLAIPPFGL